MKIAFSSWRMKLGRGERRSCLENYLAISGYLSIKINKADPSFNRCRVVL